jgi:hypothetical protein
MSSASQVTLQTKTKLVIDIIIFFGFLLAMDPRSTGIALHEWLTVAAMSAVITHLLLSWQWIVEVTRRFFSMKAARPRLNYGLNVLLFIDMTLIMFTGIMISESFMPTLGLQVARNFSMREFHDMTTNLFILLLGLHVGLHWNWIVSTFDRYLLKPISAAARKKDTNKVNA